MSVKEFSDKKDAEFEVNYISGHIKGENVLDTIFIGGIEVPN